MATTTDAVERDDGRGDAPAADDRKMLFGRWSFWLFMVGVVTMLAGTLFGYDQGVISGALQFIQTDFGLSSFMTEVVTSWVTLGALGGALVAAVVFPSAADGGHVDRAGRHAGAAGAFPRLSRGRLGAARATRRGVAAFFRLRGFPDVQAPGR